MADSDEKPIKLTADTSNAQHYSADSKNLVQARMDAITQANASPTVEITKHAGSQSLIDALNGATTQAQVPAPSAPPPSVPKTAPDSTQSAGGK